MKDLMFLKEECVEYEDIKDTEGYYNFMRKLRQEILFLYHQHYTDTEIEDYLRGKSLEPEIRKIILDFLERLRRKGGVYIKPLNKSEKLGYWYRQHRDFGKKERGVHYSNLISFEFQVEEIKKLGIRLERYMNEKTRKELGELLRKLKLNDYRSFISFYKDFAETFEMSYKYNHKGEVQLIRDSSNHPFGDFVNKTFGGRSVITEYIASLRAIILGGEYQERSKCYFPFFMARKDIREKIKGFLEARMKEIKKYFPNLRNDLQKFLTMIPKECKIARRLLSVPKINFTLFKYINWDFMPMRLFYDGIAMKKKRGDQEVYIMNFHPLSLFYSFFNRDEFEIFIDQLIHHEFVHIQQYRYIDIHKGLKNNRFPKRDAFYLKNFGKLQWIDEEKPRNFRGSLEQYFYSKGGHTPKFQRYMQTFRECKKAMKVRGKIETIYASYYYKLWGQDLKKGFWVLCNPNRPRIEITEL